MLKYSTLRGLIPFVCLAATLVGCGDGANRLYPVKGTVKYKGGPLPDARITFIPEGKGPIASGVSDSSGNYTLVTGSSSGVIAGPCKITVSLHAATGDGALNKNMTPMDMQKLQMEGKLQKELKNQEANSLIPPRYGKLDTTPLKYDVKKGDNDYPIELTD